MLSINEINDKYETTGEQKLEKQIYEAKKKGEFYIEVDENEINRVALEKFKKPHESEIIPRYLEVLEKSGYKIEKHYKYGRSWWGSSNREKFYYISWRDVTIEEYEALKETIYKKDKKLTQLENMITYLLNRNLLERILNKDKGGI